MTGPARFISLGSGNWLARANGAAAQTVVIQLHALTYKWTRVMQLANTPPLQSTTPGLHPVSIHQTSPPLQESKHLITVYYLIYRPQKDERLSRPGWLVTYRNKVPKIWVGIASLVVLKSYFAHCHGFRCQRLTANQQRLFEYGMSLIEMQISPVHSWSFFAFAILQYPQRHFVFRLFLCPVRSFVWPDTVTTISCERLEELW